MSSEVDPASIAGLVAASQQTAARRRPRRATARPPLAGTGTPDRLGRTRSDDRCRRLRRRRDEPGAAASAAPIGCTASPGTNWRPRSSARPTVCGGGYTQPTGSVEINAKRDGASAWAGVSTPDFVDVPTDSMLDELSTRLDWARAHRRAPAGPLRDADAAVDGRRHDDLPRVDHGRPRRAGGPHRAVGAGWRHAGGGEAHRPRADALLRSRRGRAGVHAVRGGHQFIGAGVGVRQRHGRRPGRLDPRRRDQCAGLPAGRGRGVRRAGRRCPPTTC